MKDFSHPGFESKAPRPDPHVQRDALQIHVLAKLSQILTRAFNVIVKVVFVQVGIFTVNCIEAFCTQDVVLSH